MGTSPLTGNQYIDGILWGGNHLDSNTITYSFWSDPSLDDDYYDYDSATTTWLGYEEVAMQAALETWSNVADIEFVQSSNNDANADFGFILVNDSEFDALGQFSPPGTFGEGFGYFNWQGTGWDSSGLQQGGFGFITMIHELGHGLGLAHPHDDGGGSSVFPGVSSPFDDTGDHGLNQGVWTTMSYNDGLVSDGVYAAGILDYGYQGTPMALDIAAIQHLYGANMSHNTGDDSYTLATVNASGTFYSCIWDAGGADTISAASATVSATINLNDAPLTGPNAGGYLSVVDGIYGGFTIANGVVIENAIGGSGDDHITGNEANNFLDGGAGDDYLSGGAGNDDIDGWTGDDSIYGNKGHDSLWGWSGNDGIHGGDGNDALYGESGNDYLDGWYGDDYLDGGSGDDDLLGWYGEDSLYGGSGNDDLYGEADNDYLNGGSGTDNLVGGSGDDTLVSYGFTNYEYDTMTGGTGSDLFILGSADSVYYQDINPFLELGYAIIEDFNYLEDDKIQVYGSHTNYTISDVGSDAYIYHNSNTSDLIAKVIGGAGVSLIASLDFVAA